MCPRTAHTEKALKEQQTFEEFHSILITLLGQKLGFTIDNGKIHNVSLGQGQEVVAEHALDVAAVEGHWVILQVFQFQQGFLPITSYTVLLVYFLH